MSCFEIDMYNPAEDWLRVMLLAGQRKTILLVELNNKLCDNDYSNTK